MKNECFLDAQIHVQCRNSITSQMSKCQANTIFIQMFVIFGQNDDTTHRMYVKLQIIVVTSNMIGVLIKVSAGNKTQFYCLGLNTITNCVTFFTLVLSLQCRQTTLHCLSTQSYPRSSQFITKLSVLNNVLRSEYTNILLARILARRIISTSENTVTQQYVFHCCRCSYCNNHYK